MLKPSRAISRVDEELKTNVSEISGVDVMNDLASLIWAYIRCICEAGSTLMTETEISETMVFNSTLIARDFTTFIHPVFSMYVHPLIKILLKVAFQAYFCESDIVLQK
jgi:hypothetical protein